MEATLMRLLGVIGTTVLALTIVAPAYAQQEQHEQQEEQKEKPAEQKEKKAQPEKPAKQEEKSAQQERNTKPEANKNNNNNEQRTQKAQPEKQAQHGGQGRIPDDRYRANFGREHTFRVSQGDYRNHRFQYGGYWFGFNAPWPSNWLYTQDVFVVEIDGVYYLCNPVYPGVNIALNVTL
jgi:hypothetical protein